MTNHYIECACGERFYGDDANDKAWDCRVCPESLPNEDFASRALFFVRDGRVSWKFRPDVSVKTIEGGIVCVERTWTVVA